MLSKRLQTTLHMKKILFNNVVMLLGQHCTDKNPVQCCPRDSRQNCTGKNLVQCRLNNGNFYFEPVNFLIITGCCKCRNTLHKFSRHCSRKIPGQHWTQKQDCTEHRQKIAISQFLAKKIVIMKTLYEEHSSKTFATFINKSYGGTERRCVASSRPSPEW